MVFQILIPIQILENIIMITFTYTRIDIGRIAYIERISFIFGLEVGHV